MHTSFMKCSRVLTVLAVSILIVPSVAVADGGNHVVRLTFNYVDPTGSMFTWLNPEAEGLYGATEQIDTEPKSTTGFSVDYEYRYSNLLGIAVNLARTDLELDILHHVAAWHPPHYTGDLAMTPLTISPQFHLVRAGALDVYCGPLLGYVFYGDLETPDYAFGGDSYGVKNGFTYGVLAGLDVRLGETNWLITGSIRYLKTTAEFEDPYQYRYADDLYPEIDIDPLVFQAGLGYRF